MFRSIKNTINNLTVAKVRKKLTVNTPWYKDSQNQVNYLRNRVIYLEKQKNKERTYVDELIKDLQQQIQEREIERDNYKEAADNLLEKVLEIQNDLKVAEDRANQLEAKVSVKEVEVRKAKETKATYEELIGKYRSGEDHTRLKIEESDKKRLKEAQQQERDAADNYGLTIKAINNRKRIEDEIAGFRPAVYPEQEEPIDTKEAMWDFHARARRTGDLKDESFEPYNSGKIYYNDSQGPLGAVRSEIDFYRGGRCKIRYYDGQNKLLNPPVENKNEEVSEESKNLWHRFIDKLSRVCDTETHCK